jgi:hypothetical protein
MAQETVGITIRINGQDKVLSSIGEIKKELKFAEEQAKFFATQGEKGAAQFQNYAQVVKQLKEEIEDSTKAVQQFSGEGKLDAVIGSVRGISGAFTAVQGALGAVGVEGEEVQKTLLKVQSALAITEGLKSLQEGIKSFKDLGKVIASTSVVQRTYNFVMFGTATATRAADAATKATSISMRILRGVMASLGIGLLIVGVTTLIDKISDWTSSTDDNKKAQERLNSALEAQEKLFSQQKESLSRQRELAVKRAELAGKSADEIFKINQDYNKKDREAAVDNFKKNLASLQTFEKEKLKRRKDGNLEGSEEDIKAYNQAKAALEKANKEIKDIDFQNQKDDLDNKIRVNEEKLKKDEEAAAKSKTLAEKEAERLQKEREDRLQAEKDADENIRIAKQEIFLAQIKDEDERAKKKLEFDLINRNREIEALNVDENRKRELRIQAGIQTQNALDLLNEEIRKKQEEKDKEFAEKQRTELENNLAKIKERQDAIREATSTEEEKQLYNLQEQYRKKLDLVKGNLEAEQALIKEYKQKEKEITELSEETKYQIISNALGGIADAVGRNTAAGKALAAAQAGIDTFAGANKALATYPPPYGAIAAGTVILAGLMNVKKILSTKLPKMPGSKGGGDNVSAPSISAPPPISPNLPVQPTLTQLNQESINQLGSASNRAYVVESDITNSQERITRINRAARLN